MRLWTLHPKYLDPKGLVALWREALLAQAVLRGETRGYLHHPQLQRFRESGAPLCSLRRYLLAVQAEADRRGYRFDAAKIAEADGPASPLGEGLIPATEGQLAYEWQHLAEKLRLRAPSLLAGMQTVSSPDPHPLFRVVPGPRAAWEIVPHGKGLGRVL